MEEELIRVPITMNLQWNYAAGRYFSRLFQALKNEGKILAVKCSRCGRVYLPPRPVCGNCFAEMQEWVEVSHQGTVRAFTVVHIPFLDPSTGQPRAVPFGMALIQLDGADTTLNHYLGGIELTKLRIGQRVEAVFRQERQGTMSDILYFKPVE
jgi:hypothetical protein